MTRFAFVRRRVVEQTIWVQADTVQDARAKAGAGWSDMTGDDEVVSMTLRRAPQEDKDDQ